jgi:uncharacterized protein
VGARSAIFVTALIFCGLHVFNEGALGPLLLFPLAVVLGYLKERTGRLAPTMVAHATFNILAFGLLFVPALR